MKLNFFLLLGLSIFSSFILCSFFNPPHVRAAYNVMESFTKKMKKEGFRSVGSGGAMMDDVQQISLDYEIYQKLDVCQARMLFLKEAEALLHDINCNLKIRPYLHDYPSTCKNIFLTISFVAPNQMFVEPPYIAYVGLHKDKVVYSTFDKDAGKLVNIYEEPYEQALKIYKDTK